MYSFLKKHITIAYDTREEVTVIMVSQLLKFICPILLYALVYNKSYIGTVENTNLLFHAQVRKKD